jgi:uncharacterized membrane protein
MRSVFFLIALLLSIGSLAGTPSAERHLEKETQNQSFEERTEGKSEIIQDRSLNKLIKKRINKPKKRKNNRPGLIVLIVIGSIMSALGLVLFLSWTVHLISGVVAIWWVGLILLAIGLGMLIASAVELKKEKKKIEN